MNEWSKHRKRVIFYIVFSTLIFFLSIPAYFVFYKPATCTDSVINGDETGVDCGGSCAILCQAEALPILSKGDPRLLELNDESHVLVAVFQNPNLTGEILRARYTFKIYSRDSAAPLKIIEGETFVPRNSTFAVFEGPIELNEESGLRVTFEWKKESFDWKKTTAVIPEILIKDKVFSKEKTDPRLSLTVENQELTPIQNLELIALLYSEEGNIIGASKTYVDRLSAGEEAQVIFTWPRPFSATTTLSEIITRVSPDKTYIR